MVNLDGSSFNRKIVSLPLNAATGFEYLLFDPPGAVDGVRPDRLVILLHGYGRNAHYMDKMAEAAREAVANARILSIHGPEPMMGTEIAGAAQDHYLHMPQEMQAELQEAELDADPLLRSQIRRQWFAIDGRAAELFPRIERAALDMNAFIDAQRDALNLDDRAILLMGFSQGAGLALYTAFTREQELGGMICHSSIIIQNPDAAGKGDPKLLSRPRVFYIYGEEDPEFPQARFHDTFNWIQNFTGGRGVEKTVAGLGHYTNAKSRQFCAAFMRDVLEK